MQPLLQRVTGHSIHFAEVGYVFARSPPYQAKWPAVADYSFGVPHWSRPQQGNRSWFCQVPRGATVNENARCGRCDVRSVNHDGFNRKWRAPAAAVSTKTPFSWENQGARPALGQSRPFVPDAARYPGSASGPSIPGAPRRRDRASRGQPSGLGRSEAEPLANGWLAARANVEATLRPRGRPSLAQGGGRIPKARELLDSIADDGVYFSRIP